MALRKSKCDSAKGYLGMSAVTKIPLGQHRSVKWHFFRKSVRPLRLTCSLSVSLPRSYLAFKPLIRTRSVSAFASLLKEFVNPVIFMLMFDSVASSVPQYSGLCFVWGWCIRRNQLWVWLLGQENTGDQIHYLCLPHTYRRLLPIFHPYYLLPKTSKKIYSW